MRPQYLRVEILVTKAEFEHGREFHYTSVRGKTAAKADEVGLALIGHEVFEYVWLTKHGDGNAATYRAAPQERATHVKVAYVRQAVSRKVRL